MSHKTTTIDILHSLCQPVLAGKVAFSELAEQIENAVFEEVHSGGFGKACKQMAELAAFFEKIAAKSEDDVRSLLEIYLLIGEACQLDNKFEESVEWFKKAIIVDDRDSLPYHELATSYASLDDVASAIKCLEQELLVAPGNYYTYLRLADLYAQENQPDSVEHTYRRLLERDPANVIALHKLILFYLHDDPNAEIHFLRKRLTTSDRVLNKNEVMIWVYHMCEDKKYTEALRYLDSRTGDSGINSVLPLLQAHIYFLSGNYSRKRTALMEFKQYHHGNHQFMEYVLKLFTDVFGSSAAEKLFKRLQLVHPRHKKRDSLK